MGAGNPLIRSFDEDMYSPETYFIDFTDSYTEDEKIKSIKEHLIANDREDEIEDLDDETINKEFYHLIEFEVESFQEDYFFNLEEPFNFWEEVDENDRCVDELSASFRGCAIILAQSEDCLILTTDEAEIHHYPIALIPRFKLEQIAEDWYDENIDKQDWYDARGLCLVDRSNDKAKEIYEKKLNKFRKKYEPFIKYFHSHWGKNLSVRNGPWMSTSISRIGDNYQFI